jgi:hypothetical protein
VIDEVCAGDYDTLPPILFLQLDNTGKDNKNKHMVSFLAFLVARGVFIEIQVSFLPKGHTHEDIDQFFSVISRKLKTNPARTLPELVTTFKDVNMDCRAQVIRHCADWAALAKLTGWEETVHFKVPEKKVKKANKAKRGAKRGGGEALDSVCAQLLGDLAETTTVREKPDQEGGVDGKVHGLLLTKGEDGGVDLRWKYALVDTEWLPGMGMRVFPPLPPTTLQDLDLKITFQVPRYPDLLPLTRTVLKMKASLDVPRSCDRLRTLQPFQNKRWWQQAIRVWNGELRAMCAGCLEINTALGKIVVEGSRFSDKTQQAAYQNDELKKRRQLEKDLLTHRSTTECMGNYHTDIPFWESMLRTPKVFANFRDRPWAQSSVKRVVSSMLRSSATSLLGSVSSPAAMSSSSSGPSPAAMSSSSSAAPVSPSLDFVTDADGKWLPQSLNAAQGGCFLQPQGKLYTETLKDRPLQNKDYILYRTPEHVRVKLEQPFWVAQALKLDVETKRLRIHWSSVVAGDEKKELTKRRYGPLAAGDYDVSKFCPSCSSQKGNISWWKKGGPKTCPDNICGAASRTDKVWLDCTQMEWGKPLLWGPKDKLFKTNGALDYRVFNVLDKHPSCLWEKGNGLSQILNPNHEQSEEAKACREQGLVHQGNANDRDRYRDRRNGTTHGNNGGVFKRQKLTD